VDAHADGGDTATIGVVVDPASPHKIEVRTRGGNLLLTSIARR
jgi:hypothetical protein